MPVRHLLDRALYDFLKDLAMVTLRITVTAFKCAAAILVPTGKKNKLLIFDQLE